MGKLDLWKADFSGKVGKLVGARWKGISTIRSYTKPSNPDSDAQRVIRAGFGSMASFVAQFADQLKPYGTLDTSGMSLRNAIIKANKAQVATGILNKATLIISKGGLPTPNGVDVTLDGENSSISAVWITFEAANLSANARMVMVVANDAENWAYVGSNHNISGDILIRNAKMTGTTADVYLYLIDYRGSTKVGSMSVHQTVAITQ
jgi:hypothetical protein